MILKKTKKGTEDGYIIHAFDNLHWDYLAKINRRIIPPGYIDQDTWKQKLRQFHFQQYNVLT